MLCASMGIVEHTSAQVLAFQSFGDVSSCLLPARSMTIWGGIFSPQRLWSCWCGQTVLQCSAVIGRARFELTRMQLASVVPLFLGACLPCF